MENFALWDRETLESVAEKMLERIVMCDRCGCDGVEEICDACSWKESTHNQERVRIAAPRLLAALERALEWIERDEMTHGRTFGVGNECRDAIQLATGKRPESAV